MNSSDTASVPNALTRAAVARELRTSIASVRRLERCGSLHPQRDGRGIHRFDPAEVAALAEARGCSESVDRAAQLEQRLATLETAHLELRRSFDALKATNDTLGALALTLLRAAR